MISHYEELMKLESYSERLNYCSILGRGYISPREEMEQFYQSGIWKKLRRTIIARDLGQDLGTPGIKIQGRVLVHHIDPISIDDLWEGNPKLLDPNNLITLSLDTHNVIHYGEITSPEYVERTPGDTTLW